MPSRSFQFDLPTPLWPRGERLVSAPLAPAAPMGMTQVEELYLLLFLALGGLASAWQVFRWARKTRRQGFPLGMEKE